MLSLAGAAGLWRRVGRFGIHYLFHGRGDRGHDRAGWCNACIVRHRSGLLSMDPNCLQAAWAYPLAGKPKAFIPVHLYGPAG